MCKKENPIPGKIIAVTNRSLCERPFLEQIKRVCETKPAALILREKDLPETEYEEMARQVLAICEEYGVICILHSYIETAKRLERQYVHLPLPLLRTCMQKTENEEKQIKFMSGNLSMDQKNKNKLILGCSVHSVEDAIEAEKLGASYLTAAKTVFASIISRYQDPDGDLGISDEGWEIAAKFLGNAHNIADGEDAVGSVIDGTYPMDEHWASGVLTEQKDRDYKFQIMTPDIGEPYVVESLAISAGTKKYDTCVAFLNWLGSSDVQLDWSNNYGTIPCQKEALDQVSDDIKELMETLKPQDLDWSFIAENVDAWVEKAELEYVQ